MEEAHALLARLERIEALDRADAPPELLLPELQALVNEAEAWARRERIARFTATMLASNAPIRGLLVALRLPTRVRLVGGGVAEVTIDLVGQSVAA